jgi:cytochrome b561
MRSDPLHEQAGAFQAPNQARRPPFDAVIMTFHWATVLLVLMQFVTAWLHGMAEVRQSDFTPILIWMHRSLGASLWMLTVGRLAWRLTAARLPPFPDAMTSLHRRIVKSSEYALYALLLGQPVTGLLMTFFAGRPFELFLWDVSPLLARNEPVADAFHAVHSVGAWMLVALAFGHAAAALFHHVVLRDDVLVCMAPMLAKPSREDAPLHRLDIRHAKPGDDAGPGDAGRRAEGY